MNPAELFTGVFGLVILVLVLAISIYWLLFPWFVYHKLDKIILGLDRVAKAVALVGVQASSQATSTGGATTLPPLPGTETYHIGVGKDITGPHTAEHVSALAAKGTLTGATWVLPQGAARWQRLDEVFGSA